MRVGVVDLGTNSVRFDICEVTPSLKIKHLFREKRMIRLGEGVFSDKRLRPEAQQRALRVFKRFQRKAAQLKVDEIIAFGTSALRDARNRGDFIRYIHQHTGIRIRVISGQEEAELIALGILAHEPLARGPFVLVDIGGGSTELSLCRNKKVLKLQSFQLGVARLQQLFLKSTPPRIDANKGINPPKLLRRHIRKTLADSDLGRYFERESKRFKPKRIIGSSGTVRTLARICGQRRDGRRHMSRAALSKLVDRMTPMRRAQLLALPGMQAKRADLILAGGILMEELMRFLNVKRTYVTDYALRDGILVKEMSRLMQSKQRRDKAPKRNMKRMARAFMRRYSHLPLAA